MDTSNIIPVWWAFFWRAALVGGVVGILATALAYFCLGILGIRTGNPLIGMLVSLLVNIPVSVWALRAALSRNYPNLAIKIERK